MKQSKIRFWIPVIGGVLLVLAGVIILLNNFNVISLSWEWIIGPMFAVGGLVFLLVFILNTNEWWALIPGFVLVGLGLIIFMGQNFQTASEQWGGAIFLGMIGLAFAAIYLTHPENWWAVIPGGVLLTLAGTTLIEENTALSGGIFFLGLALTFGLLYILPKPSGKLTWALYPAAILLVVGVLAFLGATDLSGYILPAILLVIGGIVLFRATRK